MCIRDSREGIRLQAQVAGLNRMFGLQLVAAFAHGIIRSSAIDEADFRFRVHVNHRFGDVFPHHFELVRQAIHVVDVVVFAFGILGLLVVAAAAGEIGSLLVFGARQGPVPDAVPIDILIPLETAKPIEILGGEDLAAVDGSFGIRKRIGHPVVHAQIEIGHDEYRRLELLGEIEGFHRHREALFRRAREQHGVPGVAVGEDGGGQKVALLSARCLLYTSRCV